MNLILPPHLESPPKETTGEASQRLKDKATEGYVPLELQQAIHKGEEGKKSYEEEVYETISRGRKDSNISGPFYVVVLFRKERLLTNVLRQVFFYRQSCPTPEYDQTVYYYTPTDDKVEFVWTVPNNATCQYMHRQHSDVIGSQSELAQFVADFQSGKLDRICAQRNKEVAS